MVEDEQWYQRHRSARVIRRIGFAGALLGVACLAVIGAFFLAGAITGLFI